MMENNPLNRRRFLTAMGLSAGTLALAGCESPPEERYSQTDVDQLAAQRSMESEKKGKGPYGDHVYQGYRGLAELPWFELDENGQLYCADDSIPLAIDVHCHLGMSVLFKPRLDLLARTDRVRHLLDCDAEAVGCPLDLDIYVNGNFSPEALEGLQMSTVAQGLWGSRFAKTQTIPNLLSEMDAMRVQYALLLPIKLGLPFGDDLTDDWRNAVSRAQADQRLHVGLSVHPRDENRIEEMRTHAAKGGRIIKLHPPVQRFYPDDAEVMDLYAEAEKLGLVVFFHGGRAGIEPESSHPYAMPRHYEAPLAEFPNLQFILGHAGARDSEAMLELALRYDNAWLGMHGQSLTHLETMIQRSGGERLLFGTDWPFYHLGASLAKVLITTDTPERARMRERILRGNALQLFPGLFG
jgi:predicted TIM-barrel fold metal-dependent hydrolase